MNNYLDELNNKQIEAIEEIVKPVRVIAGAGSGKTRVITTKIVYLKEKLQCRLSEILALTFTRKAAEEMRERVLSITKSDEKTNIMTFHSFCFLILIKHFKIVGLKENFQILDSYSQEKVLKTLFSGIEKFERTDIKKQISKIKNKFFDNNNIIEKISDLKSYDNSIITDYNVYQDYIRSNNKIDYDDLMLYAYYILKNNEDICEKWATSFKYILVDEFQDTNYLQMSIVNLVLRKRDCITIVGDPDQTIYTWRGAKQEIILNFEEKFKEAKTIVLDQNYRSTKQILDAANMVIKNNNKRYEKDLHTKKLDGESIDVMGFDDLEEQNQYIANRVFNLVKEGSYKYKDFFILARSNKQIKNIELTLNYYKIPYLVRGTDSFFSLKVITDSLSFLKAFVYKDNESTLSMLELLPKVGQVTIRKIREICTLSRLSIFEWFINGDHKGFPLAISNTSEVYKLCEKSMNTYFSAKELAFILLHKAGIIDKAISENQKNNHHARIKELFDILTSQDIEFSDLYLYDKLTNFLVNVTINSDVLQNDSEADAIFVSTIHGAKGMERPVVVIYDVNSFNFPNFNSYNNASYIEEERRTFYVAITRAKEKLIISYNSTYPSIFIEEMSTNIDAAKYKRTFDQPEIFRYQNNDQSNTEHIEVVLKNNLSIGDRIIHDYFGDGIVIDVMVKNIKIKFESSGIKFVPMLSNTWRKVDKI
ncbi:ATP-dependent helicase [Spiroplasma endosymbiont of Aspidapion aeneum]|uniref:ATP-dependent helicase n=1 Tax=Spiroplasma endosymbiont of Aspidapion aeneum TaxID=3066276 RepID=UPI00313B16E1